MFHLCIELGAHQNDDDRDPDPGHEADDRAERAIGLVVAAETRDVPREQGRSSETYDGSRYAAPGNPAPSRLGAARTVFVKNGEPYCDKREEDRPSADFNSKSGHPRKRNIRQSNRN